MHSWHYLKPCLIVKVSNVVWDPEVFAFFLSGLVQVLFLLFGGVNAAFDGLATYCSCMVQKAISVEAQHVSLRDLLAQARIYKRHLGPNKLNASNLVALKFDASKALGMIYTYSSGETSGEDMQSQIQFTE